jgi:tyrosine-protein kinase Etk/Wzc
MKEEQDLYAVNMDYKKIFQRFYAFKNIYIILIAAFIIAAFLYNKFASVKFKNSTLLYMSKDDKSGSMSSKSDLFQTFGLFKTTENIDNDLEILKSFSLIKKVIQETDLNVSYFSYNNTPLSDLLYNTPFISKTELYTQSPIVVIIDPSVPQATGLNFRITFLNENEFTLEADGEKVPLYNYIDDRIVGYMPAIHFKQRYKFGDEAKTRYFNMRIQKTSNYDKDFTTHSSLYFYLNDINDLTLQYQNSLKTETTSERSTLIRISLSGTNSQRITDFLNNLTSAYLGKNLDKKNNTALSTIDFIDSQISDIADSLNYAESALKNFRSSQGVMDLSFQGQQIFEQLSRLENERAALDVQRKYYEYLNNYLSTNTEISDILAPSSMNVVDPILTNLVTQLMDLNGERVSLLKNSANQQNLYLADINIRLENVKKTIKETVKNTLNTLSISLNEINYRMAKASGQISQIPKTELQLRGIERKFTLNDAIYTFLMQKRSEAQISRASNLPDYEVVDAATIAMSNVVSPKKIINFFIAIFLAMLLPSSYILIKDFLNNKITDPEELERLTTYPILGRVFHNYHRTKTVVNDHPNSSVTESFRTVRTNFQFFSEGGKRQVLLITSATSGEGKTFCSINMGSAFALNGHRTVLLEFDLRRPKIHQEFGSSNIIGISTYLIDKANLEDIIVPTHIENLDLISAGPSAPNPAELIGSERTAELIDKLKEMYDYIIIDSPPAGILAETQLLMKYTDLTILIARLEKTVKSTFITTLKSFEANKFSNISILINDLDVKRDAQKYGYDNKYYTDDKSGFLYRLFHRDKKAS